MDKSNVGLVSYESESQLVGMSRKAISDSSWTVGAAASVWIRKFSRGRTDADFGVMIGISPDQVYQRRRVYESFADVRGNYPNLMWGHFWAAIDWEDSMECLTWANDVHATVAEMRAWRRAQHGEDLS